MADSLSNFLSMLSVFGRRDSDLTNSAQKFLNSLPPTLINLFRKKRRLLPVWSSNKYCVVIKSNYLVYYLADRPEDQTDEKSYRYVNLTNCDIRIIDDDAAGFVFSVVPQCGRSVTFVADTEKDRSKFVRSVSQLQRKAPGLDDFTTLSLIGKGHYGRVILARSKINQELYALKEMKLGQTKQKVIHTERMVMEWAGDHPFVLGLDYAFGHGRSLFLVTKFMEGGDLFMMMQKRGGHFKEAAVRFYAAEVMLALEHLHAVHIVHRDIKPENILMAPDGHIKLTDMGLAKRLESSFDRTHTMCGTDAYLAPEMVSRAPLGHGPAVDMWQLGCLLYELYSGHPPFYMPQSSARQTHHRILYQNPRYPKDMSPEFHSLLVELLAKKPEERLGIKGMAQVKQHPFFKGINWKDVFDKAMDPPFKPSPAGSNLVNNFDVQFTQQSHEIKTITGCGISRDFVGFDYVNPDIEQATKNNCFSDINLLHIKI